MIWSYDNEGKWIIVTLGTDNIIIMETSIDICDNRITELNYNYNSNIGTVAEEFGNIQS